MAQFDKDIVDAVWRKAIVQPNNNPDMFRQDYAGAWICYNDFENHNSKYGWDIDRLKPLNRGGSDTLDNLYPLNWKNKESKGNNYPCWKTTHSSKGTEIVEIEKFWHV